MWHHLAGDQKSKWVWLFLFFLFRCTCHRAEIFKNLSPWNSEATKQNNEWPQLGQHTDSWASLLFQTARNQSRGNEPGGVLGKYAVQCLGLWWVQWNWIRCGTKPFVTDELTPCCRCGFTETPVPVKPVSPCERGRELFPFSSMMHFSIQLMNQWAV